MSSLLRILVLICSIGLALSATCVVPGGTTDDGPAIKTAMATCNNGGTVILSGAYTIATFLDTTALNNVAIELTGAINLNPS
jgi:galacturan 1,4-alpha-galacturonidase